MNEISIGGRKIGPSYPPFIIAELSANHNGCLDQALRLIDAAKAAGADAVKLQTYRPDTITLDCNSPEFRITEGPWAGRRLYDLYEWAHTPWEWHKRLFEHARSQDMIILSSPFDPTAVDLLAELDAPAYKIASFEAVDLPLIRYVARQGRPMIISTGMADREEIGDALETAEAAGCTQKVALHCVSGYPAPASDYNLRTMLDIGRQFDVLTGLSDHTLENTTAVAAVALGACIIEKHFTLDREGGGPDDSFSLEPIEFAELCSSTRVAWEALGVVDYGNKSSERSNAKFRRSLYFVRDIPAGGVVTADSVRSVRPGYGAAPKHFDSVVGRKVIRAVDKNSPVKLENLQDK